MLTELRQYVWEGPYARWRNGAEHDPGLCADARANWMSPGERLILRSCEMIGDPSFYLYDDHTPPAEPQTRGASYKHVPFRWDARRAPSELSVDAHVPNRARFGAVLTAREDHLDIQLRIANAQRVPLGPIDWSFCVIALESPTLRDPQQTRTFIYDGRKLRSFAELRVGSGITLIPIAGGDGFAPAVHAHLPRAATQAKASVTIVESPDARHCAAIGFEQSYNAFGCSGNVCFHADPHFGILRPGEEKTVHGRLYLIEGARHEALRRYQSDFANR